jgi:uridine kinase
MNFKELASRIRERPCEHPLRLVAIDGGAGAGKTTFADLLAAELGGAPVIPMDDFNSWIDLEGWWPRFESQVLEPAFAGKDFRYQKRDWVNDMAGDGLDEWREMPFSPLLILEGVGAARKALGKRLHYSIFIEVPAGERLERGIKRDEGIEGIRGMWERWMPFEKAFMDKELARSRADLVIDGTKPFGRGTFVAVPLPRNFGA